MNNQNFCSGCGACKNVCPTSAVQKNYNEDGWFQYTVNEDMCVRCGLCEKVCPSNCQRENLIHFNSSIKYASYDIDAASVAKSSSGGLAYAMGKVAVENGYAVVGTLYDYEHNNARWATAETVEDLEKFRGSKYIQADTDPIFEEILKSDKKYLVIGTPCQIYGLRKAAELTKCKKELIYIDFVCHGVPSYVVWNAYLRECAKGVVKSVDFRDKTYGWHNRALKIESEYAVTLEKRSRSSFYHAYDDGYLNHEQCFRCELNNGNGVSDIRIGDCWCKEYENNQTGISRVLIGTEQGKVFFEKIKGSIMYSPLEMILRDNNKRNFASFEKLRKDAIEFAKTSQDLKSVVRFYRSQLPLKNRVFLLLYRNKLFKALYYLKNKFIRR